MVICSEVEGNPVAGVTEAPGSIHEAVKEAFRLADSVWIEHHPAPTTDGVTHTVELVVFPTAGEPSYKPLDRASVEFLVGRTL